MSTYALYLFEAHKKEAEMYVALLGLRANSAAS
jgi:hypothetical protein